MGKKKNKKSVHPLEEKRAACTGCAACAAVCIEKCIKIQPDDEGFLHPCKDIMHCADCGLCLEVCPVSNPTSLTNSEIIEMKKNIPLHIYAAWHLDDNVRRASSSGGVFTALAEYVIKQNGAVVGAAFDNQLVVRHSIVESVTDLHSLRGSKYVQSQIEPALYFKIRDILKEDRYVLFVGTPCQVTAIRNLLKKHYARFYCVDLVCMGVPSPLLFKKYIDWKEHQIRSRILTCEFRNKRLGWKRPCLSHETVNRKIIYETSRENPYYKAFYMNIALRYSCYICSHKGIMRSSDLTIGDFWGVNNNYPQYDQADKGTSLVLINNEKGKSLIDKCCRDLFLGNADINTAVAGNPMLIHSINKPRQRDNFYHDLQSLHFSTLIKKYHLHYPSFPRRLLSFIRKKLTILF